MAYSRVTREERNHIHRWRQEGCGVREPIALFKFCAPVLCEMGARKSAIPQRVLQFPWKHAGTFSGQEKKPFFYPIFANTALDTGMCCAV